MSAILKGWTSAALADICTRIVDGSHNPPKAAVTGGPMLSAKNVQNRTISFDDFRTISPEDFGIEDRRTFIKSGDVLLTIVGAIGRTAVVENAYPKFRLQRSVAVLKSSEIEPKYLSYALESPKIQNLLQEKAKGTAQKGIYLKALGLLEIPLAPLPEQKRISDKLDATLARIDACRERLARVAPILKRFRQSVLAAATSGQLTADWREQQRHGYAGDDNKELRGNTHVDRLSEVFADNINDAAKPLEKFTGSSNLGEFGWKNAKFNDIGELGRGKSKHRPRNDPRLYGGAYPFIQTGDVTNAKEKIL